MTSIKNKQVRPLLVFYFTCFLALTAGAQNFGNAWVDHQLQYFKFPIHKEGIYRIDSATLGKYYNLSAADPKDFQLIFKGKELPLYIHGGTDNQINTGDYLEFYANNQVADVDSLLYTDITYVPNPFVPLFTDSVYAFLTLNNKGPNLRYTLETDTNSVLYPAANYVYAEKKRFFNYAYNDVRSLAGGLRDPRLTQAEGWGDDKGKGGTEYSAFTPLYSYQGSSLKAWFTVAYSGKSTNNTTLLDHQVEISFTDAANTKIVLSDTSFKGFVPVRRRFSLDAQDIGNGSEFHFKSVAAPAFNDISNVTCLHYFHLTYPRVLNLAGLPASRFYTDNSGSANKAFYNFQNFNTGATQEVLLYDISNNRKITTVMNGTSIRAIIPNGVNGSTCFMAGGHAVDSVKTMYPVSFSNFAPAAVKPFVIIYHKSLESSAMGYRTYRQSQAGGSYDVIMATIDELYDQFSFGVRKHPVAIRNFAAFLKDSLPSPPLYILLIGSSATPNIYNAGHALNLIPSIGWPASDNLLTASLDYTGSVNFYPDIPLGRIAATSNAQVTDYLDKVKQHENTGDVAWKKKVLHFAGGDTEALSNQLSGYLDTYKRTIEDTLFGASVHTFRKNSTAPIQVVVSDSIKDMVNAGASLLTFFGHGSRYGFDQAIDEPELYQNTGRYPFILANSCYSGDIHDPNETTVSERFVFAKQKGGVGFLASNSLGYVHALDHYSQRFYNALCVTRYNRGVGDIVKETTYLNSLSGEYITKIASLDMTLHGDPAVRIGNGTLPDYQVFANDVKFNLKHHIDSISLTVKYRNVARALRDSMMVLVERYLPGNDSSMIFIKVKAPFFGDSLKVVMPLNAEKGIGLNRFRISIDYLKTIPESNENNNSTGFVEVFIPGNDITPVYPYNFAVIPFAGNTIVKASTTDPFAPTGTYVFQLDTSDSFLKPIQSATITSKGGVIEWPVNLPFADSTVYYWRVSRDSVSAERPFNWKLSSFQTIGNQRGWGQAHFDQFMNNGYQLVTPKKDIRQFVFENRLNTVNCRTGFHPYINLGQVTYFFNNSPMDSWSCDFNGWNFAVFDSVSGLPVAQLNPAWPGGSSKGAYNNCLCDRPNKYHYVYYFGRYSDCGIDTAAWKINMENFLNNIPANNYVLAYTTGYQHPYTHTSSFSNTLYDAFESIGAKDIRTLQDTIPYVLFGRKGMNAGDGRVLKGSSKQSVLYLQDSIKTRWNNGYIASGIIGPSHQWNSLHWRVKSNDSSPGDTSVLKLVGIRSDGQADTLHTFSEDSSDVLSLHNYADAAVYPYLKLVIYMRDNVHRSSPQLQRWQVLFDEAPECALNPLKGFSTVNDSLQEGDEVSFRFPIENIGGRDFTDSLVVTYWIEDHARNLNPLPQKLKNRPFVPGQLFIDTVKINSLQMAGNNALWISVNPAGHQRYQLEQHQFNNIGRYPFQVYPDITNPLLDVTFDGRRILNGDIVSARPNILITLKDENKFLALNDTGAFTVYLQSPGLSSQQRVYFAQGLQFTPASLPKNSASILYNPELKVDGRYTLVVQARDRSRNVSGVHDYRIQFEVDNQPGITNVMNYPNPFTTSTRFVFTLTGSEIPEVFTIQVMTITGKVVREITRGELGNLRIGRNITDYAWDGRDNFGDRLANGVYLYRVLTKLNGENIEKRESGADQFFTKEFGKMVLMR